MAYFKVWMRRAALGFTCKGESGEHFKFLRRSDVRIEILQRTRKKFDIKLNIDFLFFLSYFISMETA